MSACCCAAAGEAAQGSGAAPRCIGKHPLVGVCNQQIITLCVKWCGLGSREQ